MGNLEKLMAFEDRVPRHLMFEQQLVKAGKLDWFRRAAMRRAIVDEMRFARRYILPKGLHLSLASRIR